LRLLQALKRSDLYRPDQHSYLLYPDRHLPRYVEKNNIPDAELRRSVLLRRLLAEDNRQLVERDVTGRVHFNPAVRNARDVRRILEAFAGTSYARLARREAPRVLEMFERLFDHQSFTGRSGTFFGYEGLGCIYWHMVSKLLLAAQEVYFQALDAGAGGPMLRGLAECYHDIRAGIGDYKSPADYGAFPMDAYSHTPGQGGARQPGLTGQVKEDILCRYGELGVRVRDGRIQFAPTLLRREEFGDRTSEFHYYDVHGKKCQHGLQPGELAFTYCQVPIIYRLAGQDGLTMVRTGGRRESHEALQLGLNASQAIFERTGEILRIHVSLCQASSPRQKTI
jgi:hypothetical protein